MAELEFQVAVRRRAPLLVALWGPTGGGKTFSGLLLAAGLAGPTGKVGMIDTENFRGSLYADDPAITSAMPGGKFYRMDLTPPFSPTRYSAAVTAAEKAGMTVCLIDSTSHEWSGEGGCCDIAENNKLGGLPNWAMAKLAHKRFVNHCLSSHMHIIFLMRAHEKVKPVKRGDLITPDGNATYEKSAVIPLGILPDTEKNLPYEVLLSLRVDDKTHFATPVKVPKMLAAYFPGGRMLTVEDGNAVRQWNDGAVPLESGDQLKKRARAAAELGMAGYTTFFQGLTPAAKKSLADSTHAENKAIAEEADSIAAQQDEALTAEQNAELDRQAAAEAAR